jgi:hypothetical protein
MATNPGTPAPTTGGFSDAFIKSVQDRLLSSSGVVTSEDTGLSKAINESLASTKKGTEASKLSIAGTFDREIEAVSEQGLADITTARESQRGFASQTAGLSLMLNQSSKRVNDLLQRKEELLASADAAGATAVSGLLLKEYEMQQDNTQKVFNNLLALGGFAVQNKNVETAAKAQSFTERSTIANIALKYGIVAGENDTIDTITAKAMPFASEEQKLELAQKAANIKLSNAQAQKALAEGTPVSDPGTIDALANTYLTRPMEIQNQVKDTATYARIVKRAGEIQSGAVKDAIKSDFDTGLSKTKAIEGIKNNPAIVDKASAINAIEAMYGNAEINPTAPKSSDSLTLQDVSTAIVGGLYNIGGFLADFGLSAETPRVKNGKIVNPKTGEPITFGDLNKYKN